MVDVHDMVVRLREEARRMPADSESRLLLREAGATIERLDQQVRDQVRDGRPAPGHAATG